MVTKNKKTLFVVLLAIALIAGCSGNNGDGNYPELQGSTDMYENSHDLPCVAEYPHEAESEIEDAAESQPNPFVQQSRESERQFWHGLAADAVRQNLFANSGDVLRGVIGGRQLNEFEPLDIFVTESFVFLSIGTIPEVAIVLFYDVDRITHEINWKVLSYGSTVWNPPKNEAHMFLAREHVEPRQLTNLETVTLTFYSSWMGETDPADIARETVEVYGENLWEETIRLVEKHHGVSIRDLWFDGSILYVDFVPASTIFNVGLGSTWEARAVRQSFSSFPYASEVRFLLFGQRYPLGYLGFDINCAYPCLTGGFGLLMAENWGFGEFILEETMFEPPSCICIW